MAARYLKVLVTGFLPGLLLNAWQMMIMPRLVYVLAQAEGGCFSLSDLDKRIGGIYWWWDIFNAFLGAPRSSYAVSLRSCLRVLFAVDTTQTPSWVRWSVGLAYRRSWRRCPPAALPSHFP